MMSRCAIRCANNRKILTKSSRYDEAGTCGRNVLEAFEALSVRARLLYERSVPQQVICIIMEILALQTCNLIGESEE